MRGLWNLHSAILVSRLQHGTTCTISLVIQKNLNKTYPLSSSYIYRVIYNQSPILFMKVPNYPSLRTLPDGGLCSPGQPDAAKPLLSRMPRV